MEMNDRRAALRGPHPTNFYRPVETPTSVSREERRDAVYEDSLLKGSWHTFPRPIWTRGPLGTPVMRQVRIWRRTDAIRLAKSDYVTAEGRHKIGRGLGYSSLIKPGERLGMFTGDFMTRVDFNLRPSCFGVGLDEENVLQCELYAQHWCIPSHCNDYRGLENRHTGAPGVANCALVRGDGDDVWLVAIREMRPGPRGYVEALTDYGEDCDPLTMLNSA
jgi:hypothetical protein